MLRKIIFLLVIFTAYVGTSQDAVNGLRPLTGLVESQLDLIHEHIKSFPENTQIALALIDGPQTVFYGAERRNDTLVTLNNADALFEIGSITKVFTATLLAQEVIHGELLLDQKVSGLLDITFHTGDDMTLGELASHTSGMPRLAGNFFQHVRDQSNPYADYGPDLLTEYLSKELQVLDKKEYAYSNFGFAVLGHSLSIHLKLPYAELIQDSIFNPLQMHNSVFGREQAGARLVGGLNPMGVPTSNWDMNVHAPAGGIISSVADLEKFARAQFDPENKAMVLSRKARQQIREDLSVCLGWHVREMDEGKWHSHSGGTGGYRSVMVVDVEHQKAVILLSNVSAFHLQHQKVEQLGAALMQSLY